MTNIGEYITLLEARAESLQKKYKDQPAILVAIDAAIDILPMARKAIADIYIGLDKLDKAFEPLEKRE